MKKIALVTIDIFIIFVVCSAQSKQKKGNWDALKVTANAPTLYKDFGGAFPVGNGNLGAKVFGNVAKDTIPLNEVTLWSGMPRSLEDPAAKTALVAVRKTLAEGDYKAADSLARKMEAANNEAYQPLGNLVLCVPGVTDYKNYSRELDLDKAMITIRYTIGNINFTREIFASNPGNIIVVRIYSDKKGSVNLVTGLNTQLQGKTIFGNNNTIVLTGRAPAHIGNTRKQEIVWDAAKGIGFESRLFVKNNGGTVIKSGDNLAISNADTAVLIFSAATSYNGFDKDPALNGKNPSPIVQQNITAASTKTFAQLLQVHVTDYQNIFRRLWVEINAEVTNKYALAYQWARYCLIACSRQNSSAPRNEQGIWNRDLFPNYASNYTLNENPEKYYTLSEPANIAEVTEPLINFVKDLSIAGTKTATINYGFKGWVAHHNSDVWAMTTMATGDPCWATWPVGGIWMTQHLWERYAFGLDKKYLREKAYPILKGAALFALDLMVTNKDGFLVTSPSTSPENHFKLADGTRVAVSTGSTLDMALIRELFDNCIKSCDVLNVDADFKKQLQAAKEKLLPFKIGSNGQLQEWSVDFTEWEPTHRHVSHLISLWPLSQITKKQTPELFAAAIKSLEMRGSGGYHPDKAGMWARLLNGDKSVAALNYKFPQMYDAPYGGFAEMLLQSQTGDIDLLPALPTTWKSGKILGLKARGNYEVDIEWNNGELTKATIRSFSKTKPIVRVKGELAVIDNKKIIVVN